MFNDFYGGGDFSMYLASVVVFICTASIAYMRDSHLNAISQ